MGQKLLPADVQYLIGISKRLGGTGGAFTTTTASFAQPAVNSGATVGVASTAWMAQGQTVFVSGGGYYTVTTITDGTHVVLTNLGYAGNAIPGSLVATNSAVSPGGVSNPGGLPVFNVQAYGAVGDGVHDDTAGILAALAAREAHGGGICFFPIPSNFYLCTAPIDFGQTPGTILGESAGAWKSDHGVNTFPGVWLHSTVASGYAFTIANNAATIDSVFLAVQNLSFASDSAGNATTGLALRPNQPLGIGFVNIDNVWISGFHDGFNPGSTESSSFRRMSISSCANGLTINNIFGGVQYAGAFDTCNFYDSDLSQNQVAILLEGGANIKFYNVTIQGNNTGNGYGLWLRLPNIAGQTNTSISEICFDNCWFEANKNSIVIDASAETSTYALYMHHVSFQNCHFGSAIGGDDNALFIRGSSPNVGTSIQLELHSCEAQGLSLSLPYWSNRSVVKHSDLGFLDDNGSDTTLFTNNSVNNPVYPNGDCLDKIGPVVPSVGGAALIGQGLTLNPAMTPISGDITLAASGKTTIEAIQGAALAPFGLEQPSGTALVTNVEAPDQIAGLAFWFKADVGVTTVGGINTNITAWADQSGNGLNMTQPTAAFQPVLQTVGPGPGVAAFLNTSGMQTANTPLGGAIEDVFVVALWNQTPGYRYLFTAQDVSFAGLGSPNSGLEIAVIYEGGFVPAVPGNNPVAGVWGIYNAVIDNANSHIYINGVDLYGAFTTGVAALSGFTLGGTPGVFALNGAYIGEVVGFKRHLSTAERAAVIAYLNFRWTIPGIVPTPDLDFGAVNTLGASVSGFGAPVGLSSKSIPTTGGVLTLSAEQYTSPLLILSGNLTSSLTVVLPNTAGFWLIDLSTVVRGIFTVTFQSGSSTKLTTSTALTTVATTGNNQVLSNS